jgi:hypothetical protein
MVTTPARAAILNVPGISLSEAAVLLRSLVGVRASRQGKRLPRTTPLAAVPLRDLPRRRTMTSGLTYSAPETLSHLDETLTDHETLYQNNLDSDAILFGTDRLHPWRGRPAGANGQSSTLDGPGHVLRHAHTDPDRTTHIITLAPRRTR